jgi:hypothetical protein
MYNNGSARYLHHDIIVRESSSELESARTGGQYGMSLRGIGEVPPSRVS